MRTFIRIRTYQTGRRHARRSRCSNSSSSSSSSSSSDLRHRRHGTIRARKPIAGPDDEERKPGRTIPIYRSRVGTRVVTRRQNDRCGASIYAESIRGSALRSASPCSCDRAPNRRYVRDGDGHTRSRRERLPFDRDVVHERAVLADDDDDDRARTSRPPNQQLLLRRRTVVPGRTRHTVVPYYYAIILFFYTPCAYTGARSGCARERSIPAPPNGVRVDSPRLD
jgi:hypothetical protein